MSTDINYKPLRVTSSDDGVTPPVRAPSDYVMASILATLCCCWPVGIFAILKAMQCRDAIYRERWEEATKLSLSARRLVTWTIVSGVLFAAVCVGIYVAMMFWVKGKMQSDLQGYNQMLQNQGQHVAPGL